MTSSSRNIEIRLNSYLYRLLWLLWMLGLHYFYLYYFFFMNLKRFAYKNITADRTCFFLVSFFLFQLLSTFLSINSLYFSYDRLAAILHNEIVYLFIPIGYLAYESKSMNSIIRKSTPFVLVSFSMIIIISSVFSHYLHSGISYSNLLSEIIPEFPRTVLTKIGWYEGEAQVRNLSFAIFPNATALLLLILYAISYEKLLERPVLYRVIISGLVIAGIIFTGSRIVSLFAILNLSLLFLTRPGSFKAILVVGLLFLIPFAGSLLQQLNEVYLARSASNSARYFIQSFSLKLMYETSPIFGLGIKPRVDELFQGHFPVGSHSTYIGYYVKNGLLGGSLILFFFLSLFLKSLRVVVQERLNRHKFILNILFIEILIILFFEDIDAYELNALLFGFLIAYVKGTFSGKASAG